MQWQSNLTLAQIDQLLIDVGKAININDAKCAFLEDVLCRCTTLICEVRPLNVDEEPPAWLVSCSASEFDYLVFTNREDAEDEALRQIENSDDRDSWEIVPLVKGVPETIVYQ